MFKWKRLAIAAICLIALSILGGSVFTSYTTPTIRTSIRTPIFTLGDDSYAAAIQDGKKVVKFGPLPFGIYPGGIAFPSQQDATSHLKNLDKQDQGWEVYRLSGDFQQDTYRFDGKTYTNKSLLVVAGSPSEDKSLR